MEEANTQQSTTTTEAPVESGLPSDNQPISQDVLDKFTPEAIGSLMKDGKIAGKFDSVEGMLSHIKELEDKNANTRREMSETQKQTEQTQTEQTKAQEQAALQQTTINELIPEFIQNGMVLTPEMETRAVGVGIDIRDLKLGAIDVRDNTNAAYAVVGGQENYQAMIDYGADVLTQAQKVAFDKALTSGTSELAIEGLWNRFQKAQASGETPSRVAGASVPQGLKGYEDRRSLFADKDYLETPAGSRDKAAKERYEARKRLTSDKVIFG